MCPKFYIQSLPQFLMDNSGANSVGLSSVGLFIVIWEGKLSKLWKPSTLIALGIVRNHKIRSALLLPHLPTQHEARWAEASRCIRENDWARLQLRKSLAKSTSLPQVNHLSIWKLVSLSSCLWTKALNGTFLNLSLKFSSQDIVESKFSNNQPAFQEHST